MSVRARVGVVASAAAVAAVGAIGVWMGLAATAVPNVDLGETVDDTVVMSTGTGDAPLSLEWRLHQNGDVTLTASLVGSPLARPSDFPSANSARVAIQLSCDARLKDPTVPAGVKIIQDGDEAGCDGAVLEEGFPARQTFLLTVTADYTVISGHPLREWSTSLAGQTTARTPRMLFAEGGFIDPTIPFNFATPGAYSTLTAVLESSAKDLLDLTVKPAGDVVEATSIMVQSDETHQWVDSVSWSLTYAGYTQQTSLEEGLARWTDPSGQTLAQLLLLLSGALIGVAASVAVDRMFAWTVRARRTRPTAAAPGESSDPGPPSDSSAASGPSESTAG